MALTRRRLVATAAVAAALLLVARLLAAAYADYAWYDALGAAALWRAKSANIVLLRGAAWLAGLVFVFANLYAVRASVLTLTVPRRVGDLDIDAEVPGRLLVGGALAVAAGVSALLALALDEWTVLALARYARPFAESDPYFLHDLAFWSAYLPLERTWYTWAQATLVAVSALVGTLYALTAGMRWERGSLHVTPHVRRHLAVLAALLLLLLAWGYRLERFLLVVDGGGDGLFGFVDHRMLTPLLALSVLTGTCAFVVGWAGYVGQTRIAFGGVTLALVLALGLQQLTPAILRWQARDVPTLESVAPFEGTRATYTQRAYGIRDGVDATGTGATFASPAEIAGRVALWDAAAVRSALERSGRQREVVGRVGWRTVDGRLQAVAVAREPDAPLGGADGWYAGIVPAAVAEPGYGTLSASTRALPPVFFHPGAVGYAAVADARGAIAAPSLEAGWQRLAAALAVQNLRLFVDRTPEHPSRFLRYRDVRERVRRLAPVFHQGEMVVPIVVGDSLHWAVHLYASAETYPLSHAYALAGPDGEPVATKYFRHAGAATVNAHTGRVTLVRAPDAEPLAASWMARFPTLFVAWEDAPPALRAALPPAWDAARAQAAALIVAGGAGFAADQLRRPAFAGSDSVDAELPPPVALPGRPAPAVVLPLLDRRDERLRLLAVAGGGDDPRTLLLPVASPEAPWPELVERLGRETDALAARTTADGIVVRGEVRALPVGDGAVLLQTSVVRRPDAGPALAAVALAIGDSVVAGESLARVVARPPGDTLPAVERAAPVDAYRRMRDALRRLDWDAFGRAFDDLGRALGVPPTP